MRSSSGSSPCSMSMRCKCRLAASSTDSMAKKETSRRSMTRMRNGEERRGFLAPRTPPVLILVTSLREVSLFLIESVLEAANLHLQRMLIEHGDDPDEERIQITVHHTGNTNVLSVTEQLRRIPGVREIRHTLS